MSDSLLAKAVSCAVSVVKANRVCYILAYVV